MRPSNASRPPPSSPRPGVTSACASGPRFSPSTRSEERRVGKEWRYWRDWSSDVCSPICLAMRRAIEQLNPACDYLLTDAMPLDLGVPCEAIIDGDATVQCIAAASILAKTRRDQCMREWSEIFPEYEIGRASCRERVEILA